MDAPPPPRFGEALRFWWKLGWISFGGPAGQIAILQEELIVRRRWISGDQFMHALNFCMTLPGPEAQQLVTYLGWRLHGAKGGIAAGVLFVLPSAFLLFGLSWLYMAGGDARWIQGLFNGLIPAVIAIIFCALIRIGNKALKTPALWLLALTAFIAVFSFHLSFLVIIPGAALVGLIGGKFLPHQFPGARGHGQASDDESPHVTLPAPARASLPRSLRITALCLTLWWLPVLAAGLLGGWQGIHFQQGLFFSKAALVTFGGAYAVLPYVAQTTVERFEWLDQHQMMTGLGLAETTPGPLIMVLQFVGFVSAWQHPGTLPPLLAATLGAMITTWVTFLPSFYLVFMGAPHVESLQTRPLISTALTAVTAAVVGVILNLGVNFAWHALKTDQGSLDPFVALTAIAASLAIGRFKLGTVPILAACAAVGTIRAAMSI